MGLLEEAAALGARTAATITISPIGHRCYCALVWRSLFLDHSRATNGIKVMEPVASPLFHAHKFRARLHEPHECSTLMQLKPASLDAELEPGAVLRRRALVLEQEWPLITSM